MGGVSVMSGFEVELGGLLGAIVGGVLVSAPLPLILWALGWAFGKPKGKGDDSAPVVSERVMNRRLKALEAKARQIENERDAEYGRRAR
jgi:hypothetical protein